MLRMKLFFIYETEWSLSVICNQDSSCLCYVFMSRERKNFKCLIIREWLAILIRNSKAVSTTLP